MTNIYTDSNGKKYIKATKPNGDVYGYYLEGNSHQVSKPEKGVNYVGGFTPGAYYTRINTNGFKIEPETINLPEVTVEGKNESINPSINTDATKLTSDGIKGIYTSEDEDVWNALNRLATRDINLAAIDKLVREGWGDKGRLEVAGMLGAGALGATLGAYTLPIFSTELMGAANLYGGYHGIKNLTSEEGLKKTYEKIKNKDYEGALYSGIGDIFDIASTFPLFSYGKQLFSNINKIRNMKTYYTGVPGNVKRNFGKSDYDVWTTLNPELALDYASTIFGKPGKVFKVFTDENELNILNLPKNKYASDSNHLNYKFNFETNKFEIQPNSDIIYYKDTDFFNLHHRTLDPLTYAYVPSTDILDTNKVINMSKNLNYDATKIPNVIEGEGRVVDDFILHKGTPYYFTNKNLSKYTILPLMNWYNPKYNIGLLSLYNKINYE